MRLNTPIAEDTKDDVGSSVRSIASAADPATSPTRTLPPHASFRFQNMNIRPRPPIESSPVDAASGA